MLYGSNYSIKLNYSSLYKGVFFLGDTRIILLYIILKESI